MSLVGNLEDLGLGDILQIVSLSRKSGVLSLQSRGREGKIIFLNGQVIRATASTFRENLGDLLLRQGLVDVEMLKKALYLQRHADQPQRIGEILAERFGLSQESIESSVRAQLEKIIYSFFGWGEGTFSFEVGEPTDLAASHINPLQFMFEQGLNPQWLAMEGSRLLDEKRHRGESLEESGDEPLPEVGQLLGAVEKELPVGRSQGLSTVYLIDDDVVTRERLGRILQNRGFVIRLFEEAQLFLQAVQAAVREKAELILVIDLIMPRPDGSGIFGGLDLLEQVRHQFPELTPLVMSDYPNPEIERKVRQLGVPTVVSKPKKSEVREERGLLALEALGASIAGLAPQVGKEERLPDASLYNLGAELLQEMGVSPATAQAPEKTHGLHLLRGMLQELSNPTLGGGIILLVLRFASEFMNRAVIFLVKEPEIVGLGQFGIELANESADSRVRRMKIPTQAPTLFSPILENLASVKGPMGVEAWDHYLREQLGGGMPEEVFVGPLLSEGKIVAILYGDNLPEYRPIGDTEALEIFLSQAGLAMEKALLERRLRGKEVI
ncbi:MAG: DUF4388 domain-containing protein [Desulfuromonadales bacterium]|nr:DUF4388 domain-containing protein [Desulfuromonadales bacterium]